MHQSKSSKKRAAKKARSKAKMVFWEILSFVWIYVRMLLDIVIYTVFGWWYSDKKDIKLPPVSEPFLLESATSIAGKIRSGKLRAETVVSAYIERAKQVNGILNAVVDDRFDAAIQEAIEIDKNLSNIDVAKKPFLGVPFTTKESTACAGMLHTFGIIARKDCRATEDAEIVALMKNAGAILIANTNIPELNLWQESRNNLYGQTCNPYDVSRTAGGSSGGEASLLAACGSAFGLGSDIGGSIRLPSFFCGVYGHKPTTYLVPTRGLTRRTGTEKPTMVVAGPLCRHAEDLAPLMKVLLRDNVTKLKLDVNVDLRSLKYFYADGLNDARCSPVCSELKGVMKKVVDHFSNEVLSGDEKVQRLDYPEFKWSSRLWRHMMSLEKSNFAKELTNQRGQLQAIPELLKKLIGQSDYTIAAILMLLNNTILPKEDERWANEMLNALKEKLMPELQNNGVLFFHSFSWPANYHYTAILNPYNFSYCSIFNALQLPVTQIPFGLSKEGLPMGLQIVAAPYNDHLCFAVAKHLEKVFGGYVPPFTT